MHLVGGLGGLQLFKASCFAAGELFNFRVGRLFAAPVLSSLLVSPSCAGACKSSQPRLMRKLPSGCGAR